MTEQLDPYKLDTQEMQELVNALQRLLTPTEAGQYENLQEFLRHRRTYLEQSAEQNEIDFKVQHRLSFDIYRKNYSLHAEGIPAQFIEVDGKPLIQPKAGQENYTVRIVHSDGLGTHDTISIVSSGTCYDGKSMTTNLTTHYESRGDKEFIYPFELTSVVYAFTLEGTTTIPTENKGFISIFHEQKVNFRDIPPKYQEVLGAPAWLTGFFEYDSKTETFDLFVKYRE